MLSSHSTTPLRRVHLLVAVLLFGLLVALSYPFYRYFVDPDAVAYLTMATRAATGEPWRLVNALWSPLHPALVALCVKGGMEPLPAAQLTNALACLLILVATFSIFRKAAMLRMPGLPLLLALSVFLCYALYKQLFCDLWQVALLLFYLRLLSVESFLKRPQLWVLAGILMALSAYAKIYSFYFLLLHFPIAVAWLGHHTKGKFPWKAAATGLLTMCLLMLPLALLMHHKYRFWGLSKSGALNTSWTLAGHKSLRPDFHALIPPPYANSPYTWEDPFLAEGSFHSRFESLAMMKSQMGHSLQAALQGVEAASQISPFLLIIFLATGLAWVLRSVPFPPYEKLWFAAVLIMPLGYLLLHFEARYIWLLLPLGMVFGAKWLLRCRPLFMQHKRLFALAGWLLAASFVVYPAYDMKALFRSGEDTFHLAKQLRSIGVEGSFYSNEDPNRAGLLAYWMGSRFYTPSAERLSHDEVLQDMRRYGVKYYFDFQSGLDVTIPVFPDEQKRPFPQVDSGRIAGLRIFLVTPGQQP